MTRTRVRVIEEDPVFRDLPSLLFTQDGVPADLVRAGEPRRWSLDAAADDRTASEARVRRPALFRRLRTS
jgi:hypothetical protein